MNENIIRQMTEIVDGYMTSYQSDFYGSESYSGDKSYVEKEDCKFPMLWIVGKSHTYLLKLGEYEDWILNDPVERYRYVANGESPFGDYVDHPSSRVEDRVFLIEPDKLTELDWFRAKNVIKDVVTPVIERYKDLLPKRNKVRVQFYDITLNELLTLIRKDSSLLTALKRFHSWLQVSENHHIDVFYHKDVQKFWFEEQPNNGIKGLCGSITYHGSPTEGYKTNGSIQLEPEYGWHTHT